MDNNMLNESSLSFLADLASEKPAPGGGGAAALTGAMGSALGMMVVNLTQGKKKYVQYEQDHVRLLEDLEGSLNHMIELVQADADNFIPLSKAYGLPNSTEEEKANKVKVLEECLQIACQAPMDIMEEAVKAMASLEELMEKGSKMVLSDVGAGVALLNSSVQAASLNIFINAKMMKNQDNAKKMIDRTNHLTQEAEKYYQEIFHSVKEIIS